MSCLLLFFLTRKTIIHLFPISLPSLLSKIKNIVPNCAILASVMYNFPCVALTLLIRISLKSFHRAVLVSSGHSLADRQRQKTQGKI